MCALVLSGTLTLYDDRDEYVYNEYPRNDDITAHNYNEICDAPDVMPRKSTTYKLKQDSTPSWTFVSYDNSTGETTTTSSRSMSVTTHQRISQVDVSGRIVGGDAHNIKEFPFFASLLQHNYPSCGGSILTSEYVLSAAHCFESGRASDWTVIVGISKGSQRYAADYDEKFKSPVQMILVHDEYDPVSLHADIAMLKMSDRIESWSDFIQPACIRWLEDDEPENNDPVYVIGMGVTSEGGQSADQLMGVGISVLSASYCNHQFGATYITEGMICAGYPPGGKDACQADSGGPLLHAGSIDNTTDMVFMLILF